jgi:hypothetical protein
MKIKDVPPGSQVYATIRYPADRGTGKWEGYAIADENGVAEIDLNVATQTTPIIVQIRDMHHVTAKVVPALSTPPEGEVYTLPKSEPTEDEFDWFMEGGG